MKINSNAIQAIYNSTAIQYSINHERRYYWLERQISSCANYLDANNIKTVIDIGCGSGVLLESLASKYKQIRFIGIDFSEELIKIANQNSVLQNVEYINADFTYSNMDILKSKDVSFEKILILVFGAMEYYKSTDAFTLSILNAWKRVETGAILMTFHNEDLFGRAILKNEQKKYWKVKTSLALFKDKECKQTSFNYFSFILFDFIASKTSLFDKVLYKLDTIFMGKFQYIRKKTCMNFEILLSK